MNSPALTFFDCPPWYLFVQCSYNHESVHPSIYPSFHKYRLAVKKIVSSTSVKYSVAHENPNFFFSFSNLVFTNSRKNKLSKKQIKQSECVGPISIVLNRLVAIMILIFVI